MKKPIVSIVRVDDISKSVKRAVELAGGLSHLIKKSDTVLLKPNVKNQSLSGYGVVTDARVVDALLELLNSLGVNRTIIAEGAAYPTGSYNTMSAYEVSGVMDVAKKWGSTLVDLNDYNSVDVEIPNASVLKKVRIGRAIREADVIINVPVLKTHSETLLSACLKNFVGIATREEKKVLHRLGLNEALIDLCSTVKAHFNVVDAIVALEGDGPNLPPGKPKRLDLIIAGNNWVAVDAVCASIIGINPNQVSHLKLAEKRGLGTLDLNQIEVVGEPLEKAATRFELPRKFIPQ